MNNEAVQLFSAILALATLAGGVVTLFAMLFGSSQQWAENWLLQIRASGLWLICMITTGAMVGSLYFSENVGYAPCKLCWYQRIAMYSLAIILVIAAVRKDRAIVPYATVLAAVGAGIAGYHWLLERWPSLDTGTCSADTPCSVPYFEVFGFVSLAFMAFSAFVTVLVFLWVVSPSSAATIETESESVSH